MDKRQYDKVFELERNGKLDEAFRLLEHLAGQGDPMALMELSTRYYSTEGYACPVFPLAQDIKKSKELEQEAKAKFEELASDNDGDAMRMLGYYYLCFWGLCEEKNVALAEQWLVDAYDAKCFFAANDLATLYLGSDIERAKFYYKEATRHRCRVVYHAELEA